MPRIIPNLWFDTESEAAAEFSTSVFPNSRITGRTYHGEAGPREAGTVMTVDFELDGQPVTAIDGGPQFRFSPSVSLLVECADQAEVDRYWAALSDGRAGQTIGPGPLLPCPRMTSGHDLPPVSAVADVLVLWGLDGWLTPPLRPVVAPAPERGEVVGGAARTVTLAVGDTGPGLAPLYGLLSSELAGDVLVLAGAGDVGAAVWGEILATAAVASGASAVLVDGSVRDRPATAALGLALYARDERVVGPNGRAHVVDLGAPVALDGADGGAVVGVDDGDLVLCDATGCVRVRRSDADEVLDGARRYAEAEQRVVDALRAGDPLTEAYLLKKRAVDALRAGRRPPS